MENDIIAIVHRTFNTVIIIVILGLALGLSLMVIEEKIDRIIEYQENHVCLTEEVLANK